MPDREKYIEVLSKTVKTMKEFNDYTPIKISLECVEDILELLKEQEAVEPVLDSFLHKRCPSCRALLNGKFCHECGQAVKWDD